VSVLVCALVAGLAAWALTPLLLRCATSDAPILRRWLHVPVAAVLGGLAGLASSWAEMLAFVVLAVASGLLTVIDIAEERLPDAIVLPLIGLTAALFTLAAWTTGNWSGLLRAGLAALALFVLSFAMMVFSPDLGFGDVKLAVVTGAFCGWFSWGAVLLGFGAAWILFALTGVVALATRTRGLTGSELKTSLPFGPFLILGAVVGACGAGSLLSW
jgi:leader peptidase (prepilin peptidase)/N-methyltransferase